MKPTTSNQRWRRPKKYFRSFKNMRLFKKLKLTLFVESEDKPCFRKAISLITLENAGGDPLFGVFQKPYGVYHSMCETPNTGSLWYRWSIRLGGNMAYGNARTVKNKVNWIMSDNRIDILFKFKESDPALAGLTAWIYWVFWRLKFAPNAEIGLNSNLWMGTNYFVEQINQGYFVNSLYPIFE